MTRIPQRADTGRRSLDQDLETVLFVAGSARSTADRRPRIRIATGLMLIGLVALGAVHWAMFFNFGEMTFRVEDWPKEFIYYSVLREWMQTGQLPLHITPALQDTSRFFAIPETVLSPQIVLLRWLPVGPFVVANTALMFAVGFCGCLLIRRRYRLSAGAFVMLYLLFNYNGYIVSHLAVGHSMWNGYFLLPFFVLYVLDLVMLRSSSRDGLDRTALKLSLVLFGMMLQGSVHMFVWCLLFLGLVAAFNSGPGQRRAVALAVGFGTLLSAFRLVPAAITLWQKTHPFLSGYPTITDLLSGFVMLKRPRSGHVPGLMGSVDWWEYDFFIGIIAVCAVFYWGIYLRFKPQPESTQRQFAALDGPLLVMSIFSLGAFYALVAQLPLPMIASERVPSRMLVVPFVVILVIACIRFEQAMPRLIRHAAAKWLVVAGLAQTAMELATHSKTWRIEAWEPFYVARPVDFSYQVIQSFEPIYNNSLIGSLLLSAVSLTALIVWSMRAPRTPHSDHGAAAAPISHDVT